MEVFARAYTDALRVLGRDCLPDGVDVITVPCMDAKAFMRLSNAVSFEGTCYGKSGWNSDRFIAYYRTDVQVGWKQ